MVPTRSPSTSTPRTTEDGEEVAWPFISDRRRDAVKSHDRPDRQVDPARDHDDRLGDGANATGRIQIARPWIPAGP